MDSYRKSLALFLFFMKQSQTVHFCCLLSNKTTRRSLTSKGLFHISARRSWKRVTLVFRRISRFRSVIGAALKLWATRCAAFTQSAAASAAWIWFHREVVNMPVFSTSLLFWHAQLRHSSSKVSAWGCGPCRSAFTHTSLQLSRFSPQYGRMLLQPYEWLNASEQIF